MTSYHIAQFNIARGIAPLDDPRLADFMARLDEINALADAAPGFVWRLQDDSGSATDIQAFDDPRMLVNLSVWRGIDSLFDYVYKTEHARVMARRREWFEKTAERRLVLWWVPAGHIPGLDEAKERLDHLNRHGPSDYAFSFKETFAPPVASAS